MGFVQRFYKIIVGVICCGPAGVGLKLVVAERGHALKTCARHTRGGPGN